jgi:hypothetical protein
MSIDLEFAIKQDIRNNPVVREVDADRSASSFGCLSGGCHVAMLIVALAPKSTTVTTGYRVEDLKDALAREDAIYRQYRLEMELLLRPQLLEQRATSELGLVAPTERDTLVIERVPASSPPNRAIVAAVR